MQRIAFSLSYHDALVAHVDAQAAIRELARHGITARVVGELFQWALIDNELEIISESNGGSHPTFAGADVVSYLGY